VRQVSDRRFQRLWRFSFIKSYLYFRLRRGFKNDGRKDVCIVSVRESDRKKDHYFPRLRDAERVTTIRVRERKREKRRDVEYGRLVSFPFR